MRFLFLLLGWCLLFCLCWPMAVLFLVLAPLVWLLFLPLRLLAICLETAFAVIRGILSIPARLLGRRG